MIAKVKSFLPILAKTSNAYKHGITARVKSVL